MAGSISRRAALALLAAPAFGQRGQLRPVDDSRKDPKLAAFVANLREIIRRKDAAALLNLVLPTVKNSFGGDDGIEEFRKLWKLDQPNSEVFPLLERMLDLGLVADGDVFSMPYVYAKFPDEFDPFEYGAVTGEGVWMRKQPSSNSPGLRQLSYEIVRLLDPSDGWQLVETQDGVRGFVASRYLWSPVGYRAIFLRQGETWKLEALIAGD